MIIKEKSIKSYIALENVLRYILSKQTPENSFVFKRYIKGDVKHKVYMIIGITLHNKKNEL